MRAPEGEKVAAEASGKRPWIWAFAFGGVLGFLVHRLLQVTLISVPILDDFVRTTRPFDLTLPDGRTVELPRGMVIRSEFDPLNPSGRSACITATLSGDDEGLTTFFLPWGQIPAGLYAPILAMTSDVSATAISR